MDWIENEYGSMNIGDERLNKRSKQRIRSQSPGKFNLSTSRGLSAGRSGRDDGRVVTTQQCFVYQCYQ